MRVKFALHSFLPYETDEMECYLKSMADKQYLLCGMYGSILKFSNCQWDGVRYEYHLIDNRTDENAVEQRARLKCEGWVMICQNFNVSVFRRCSPVRVKDSCASGKTVVASKMRTMQRNSLLFALLFVLIGGNGFAISLTRLSQSSLFTSKHIQFAWMLFIAGSMLLFDCAIYWIAELHDTVIQAKQPADLVSYMRTPFKRVLFTIGDWWMILALLSCILISVCIFYMASLQILVYIFPLWIMWACCIFFEWSRNTNFIRGLAILAILTYAILLILI